MTDWVNNSIDMLIAFKDFIASGEGFKIFCVGAFVLACVVFRKVVE